MAIKTFVSGEILTAADTNTYLRNGAIAIFNETQATGTSGGTNVLNTWTKRTLNTTVINQISGCSISSSVITLGAGVYMLRATSPFVFTNNAKIRLRNTSDGSTTLVGIPGYTNSAAGGISTIDGSFTLTGSKNFEIQYYTQLVQTAYGLGLAGGGSESEIFTTVYIQQVGA